MMRLETLWLSGILALVLGCSEERPSEPPPPAPQPSPSRLPHGDHVPRYGGVVLMHGDLHFEVVLDDEGRHRVYFSDAVRTELPAAIASDVTIEVDRPGEEREPLVLEIDEYGESWVAAGEPVRDPEATALVRFTFEGEPYEIELPFLAPPPDPDAPDPHATPVPPP